MDGKPGRHRRRITSGRWSEDARCGIGGGGRGSMNLYFTAYRPLGKYFFAMGAALELVGPGAWSVDARLFGWKRIDVPVGRH